MFSTPKTTSAALSAGVVFVYPTPSAKDGGDHELNAVGTVQLANLNGRSVCTPSGKASVLIAASSRTSALRSERRDQSSPRRYTPRWRLFVFPAGSCERTIKTACTFVCALAQKLPKSSMTSTVVAEGVGFEPTVPLQARRFSRPVP
jgi:hypothetical protein